MGKPGDRKDVEFLSRAKSMSTPRTSCSRIQHGFILQLPETCHSTSALKWFLLETSGSRKRKLSCIKKPLAQQCPIQGAFRTVPPQGSETLRHFLWEADIWGFSPSSWSKIHPSPCALFFEETASCHRMGREQVTSANPLLVPVG